MANKNETWEFFKLNFKWLLAAALVLILYFQGCFDRFKSAKPTVETKTETVQVPQPIIVMPPYTPQQSGSTSYPIVIPSQYNPSADIKELTEQYKKLANEFLAVKTYKDKIELKDSAGTDVGTVDLTQIVSENTLKSTQPTYKLKFPHTTTTVTITEKPKPRNQVFIGVGMESLVNKPNIEQVNAGILMKNKKDLVVGFSGTYHFPSKSPGVQISLYKLISFKPIKSFL